jgi:hypothetical protein
MQGPRSLILALCLVAGSTLSAQPADDSAIEPISGLPLNHERILGVIPDYQTVRDSTQPVSPLNPKQKWQLAWKETIDPFNISNAALGAALSQADNETPQYGHGDGAYAKRFAAALGDFGSQNFFSAGLLANLFHQDPRYFRRGPSSHFFNRVGYSISRIGVTRQDSGKSAFNVSGIGGMMLGIAASNAYYPSASRTGGVMASRIGTSLLGGVMGNLLSEFWPDIESRFLHKHHYK